VDHEPSSALKEAEPRMKGPVAAVVALAVASGLVGVSSWVGAQDPGNKDEAKKAEVAALAPFPAGYLDHSGLSDALDRLAKDHPKAVAVRSLAKTREGRDVWIATVGRAGGDGPPKPALLLVANLEADHVVGSHVALGLVERLAGADGKDPAVTKLLDERTLYIVPRLNPDGAERLLKGTPRVDFRANLAPIDRDRDGRFNEDGPNDLDGDGLSLTIRIKDPARATLIPDAKDARLLRKADPAKGERPVYSEATEGIDDDGDGLIDEDPAGGVNLNRNWPQAWTEFNPEAGVSPASEPEVNALIRFAFAHPEIVAVWSFGLNDNLKGTPPGPDAPYLAEIIKSFAAANTPKGEAAPKDEPKAEAPKDEPAKKADTLPPPPADAPKAKGKGQGGGGRGPRGGGGAAPTPAAPPVLAPGIEGTTDGALSEWAYQQFGVLGLASRLWPRPEGPGLAGEGDARWLEWNDKVMGGSAFVPFHEVDHPKHGKVEVGGWKPGVRLNPPIDQMPAIADRHLAFLKDLLGRLPGLAIREAKAEAKGGGIFEVKATVENPGYLPTALAQGVTTRKAPPVLVKLDLRGAKLLAGQALNRIDTLAGSGGFREYHWLLLAPEGVKAVTLDVSCPKAGSDRKDIPLPGRE